MGTLWISWNRHIIYISYTAQKIISNTHHLSMSLSRHIIYIICVFSNNEHVPASYPFLNGVFRPQIWNPQIPWDLCPVFQPWTFHQLMKLSAPNQLLQYHRLKWPWRRLHILRWEWQSIYDMNWYGTIWQWGTENHIVIVTSCDIMWHQWWWWLVVNGSS